MIPSNTVLDETRELPTGAPSTTEGADPGKVVVDTRFGRFEFDRDHAVYMPRGMTGFPDNKTFGLAQIPDPRMENFMLLQSLSGKDLSFLLMPLAPDSGFIEPRDIATVRDELGIVPEDLVVVLVVSVRKIGGKAQVSVNLRAPVFVDVRNRSAWQHVLPNGKYPIRYVLNPATEEAAKEAC